jgi:hypothetical protein
MRMEYALINCSDFLLPNAAAKQESGIMIESAAHVRIIEETSANWRVLCENPPFNIVDATIFEGLQDLLARMDASPSVRVVVFESANPSSTLPTLI